LTSSDTRCGARGGAGRRRWCRRVCGIWTGSAGYGGEGRIQKC
jgi:hypothetical protein